MRRQIRVLRNIAFNQSSEDQDAEDGNNNGNNEDDILESPEDTNSNRLEVLLANRLKGLEAEMAGYKRVRILLILLLLLLQ
jgi:hypothetical protein